MLTCGGKTMEAVEAVQLDCYGLAAHVLRAELSNEWDHWQGRFCPRWRNKDTHTQYLRGALFRWDLALHILSLHEIGSEVLIFCNSGPCLVMLKCFQVAKDNVFIRRCLHGEIKSDNTGKVVMKNVISTFRWKNRGRAATRSPRKIHSHKKFLFPYSAR
ncbi:uncharacterized protein BYT42DRAFT_183200 [Radiomyces spectabilis]|uniref:uncharacterized protein n=1 Tax=Radiomyces spectabilis TaxID=64574 RepID=UPI00221F7A5A|nr:uncharacterized protein BYT42DRAFT_183200 [Radiomyces spectabilis]KAI8391142.1 hypothetical protein BYT42DRAFT_183200 [Radiomyces spectabilis]